MADTPDGKTYTPEPSSPDGLVTIGDDLTSEAKETLASYLSSLTADPMQGNAFPIEPDNPAEEFKLQNADGTPAEFETGGTDTTVGWTRSFPEGDTSSAAAVPKFETLSNSGKFDIGAPAGIGTLSDYVDKNSQTSGNDLLRSFVSTQENDSAGVGDTTGQNAFPNPTGAPDVQKKISMILTQGNRFDPTPSSSPYIEGGEMTEPGIPIEQGAFGVYDNTADRTSIGDLRKVALGMMLRATGHAYSGNPSSASVGPATGVQKGSSNVSTKRLMAASQWSAPDRPSLVDAELEYDDRTGDPLIPRPSVGQLNSYKEQFGKHVIRQMRVTIATLGELLIAAAIFAAVMTLLEVVYGSSAIPSGPHQMKKGMHRNRNLVQRTIASLGIPITTHPMWICVCYGIAAFFKIPESMLPPVPAPTPPGIPGTGPVTGIAAWFAVMVASAGASLVSIFFNMQYASGYYATILRVMRQDLERLLDIFGTLPTASPGAAAFAIYELISNLNSFASWRFFCTLAIMGDRWLQSKTRTFAEVASINNMPDNGQTRQAKSRVTTGNPALAWRHRSSPAVILLPHKLRGAYSMYGFSRQYAQRTMDKIGDTNSYNAGQPYTGQRRRVVSLDASGAPLNGRIPQWLRESVERELNSEYCPFYFHDLRTNEVISFHAFLEDLTDSYSVSYAESAGYGRIDPVKIYQNTTRSVSLTWTLVATSREDFDSMWWSVNKLVSMCYPQFSMGKPLQAGTKKFVMPFSQIPTASPVIRLRVGDVIRSNYSRFNLARIFGLSEGRPAHGVDAPGVTGATTDPADIEEGSNAPFDLSYTETMEEAAADAETATAMEIAAINMGRAMALSAEPTSPTDFAHGYQVYVEDYQATLQLGRAYLKANSSIGYTCYDTDDLPPSGLPTAYFPPPFQTNPAATHTQTTPWPTRTTMDGLVKIKGRRIVDPTDGDDEGLSMQVGMDAPYAEYAVQMADVADPADPYHPEAKGHFHTFIVTAADLYPVPPHVEPADATPDPVSLTRQVNDIYDFFHPDNNAIVRSFEAAGGQGLAGVITSFDMDWGEAMWDMSAMGRRAPQFIKCSISFSPIHDIVPGLDNNGAMRAYNYPVGKINSGLQEDFFDYGAARGVAGRLNTVPTNLPSSENSSPTQERFRDNVTNAYGFNADEPGID